MSIAAIGELGALAPSTGAGGVAGGGSDPLVAAAERIQQLQELISRVEHGTPGGSFGAALDAAETAGAGANLSQPGAAGTQPEAPADETALAAYDPANASPGAEVAQTPISAYGLASTSPGAGAAQTPVSAYDAASTVAGPDTPAAGGAPLAGAAYVPSIEAAAARNGLEPGLLYGLIEQESGFDPGATSSAGAEGLTQLMPATAASLGVANPLDPAEAIEGGARFLAEQMRQFGGNTEDALAAYNAGPGAVQQYGGVPPYAETQQYVSKVLGDAAAYNQSVAGEVSA